MNKIALSFAILALSAGTAFAQVETDFATVDADTSGEISFDEALVIVPDLTQEAFDAADTDTSTGLSVEEFDLLVAGSASATPAAPATIAPDATDAMAPAATDINSGSTSSSETMNMGGDAGAGN